MEDSNLRKHIRKTLSEFFNNAWVYTYGPNKFPNFDGLEKTPSDLDAEADALNDDTQENQESVGLKNQTKKVHKKSILPNKH